MKKPQFESKKAFEKQRVFAEKNDNNNDQYFTPLFDKKINKIKMIIEKWKMNKKK